MTLDQLDLNQIFTHAKEAVGLGREVLLDYYGRLSRVNVKDQGGLVTEADVESERVITEFLAKTNPHIHFLAEEDFAQQSVGVAQRPRAIPQQPCWILDPLDGTTNYVHQFPIFCISLGLLVNDQIVLGIIDAPLMKQFFHAQRGQGAFLNSEAISVSQRTQLSEALLATGFFSQNKDLLDQQISLFGRLVNGTRGVRRAGAAAYDLCMVASGVFDGFWEQNLMPWDTAAGSLIVEEAGGCVSNFQGKAYHPLQDSLLAANPQLHSQLLSLI